MTFKSEPTIPPLAIATVLGLAFAYYFRLPSAAARNSFVIAIRNRPDWKARAMKGKKWGRLANEGVFEQIIELVKKRFTDNFVVEDGIAMNFALAENLFVVVVCILNKIPVFLVGKPGSSKTLTLQVPFVHAYC